MAFVTRPGYINTLSIACILRFLGNLVPRATVNTYFPRTARFGQYFPRAAVNFYRNFVLGPIYARGFYLIFPCAFQFAYLLFRKIRFGTVKCVSMGQSAYFSSKGSPYSHSFGSPLGNPGNQACARNRFLLSAHPILVRIRNRIALNSEIGNFHIR